MDTSKFECYSFVRQEFLVCVTVYKAQNLSVFNADTYVLVTLDKKHKRTRTFTASENPYFNEYFVFEMFCSLAELLRLTVHFEVKKKNFIRRDMCVGELLIDLETLWSQPLHSFFKKWGKLENPLGKASDVPRGHLQIDLCIVSRNDSPQPVVIEEQDLDDIEKNLLKAKIASQNIQNVKYYLTIMRGIFSKKADYSVQISFAGMNEKTKIQKGTSIPEWHEQFSVNWYYPSLSQTFYIQILTHDLLHSKCIASYEIPIDKIGYTNENPSLGPAFLHFYDPMNSNNYIGRLLIDIKCDKYKKENAQRTITRKRIRPIDESVWWSMENFFLECLIWQGDFIHTFNASTLKLSMKCAEFSSTKIERYLQNYEDNRAAKNLKYFIQDKPFKTLHMTMEFPDCRQKFQVDHFIYDFIDKMRTQIDYFHQIQLKNPNNKSSQAKCLRRILQKLKNQLQYGRRLHYKGFKHLTDWDINRLKYIQEFFETQIKDFEMFRRCVKTENCDAIKNVENTFKSFRDRIEDFETLLASRIQDEWPWIILSLSVGVKEVAICKVNAKNFLYSQREECAGKLCGARHQLVFKPITCKHSCQHCGCVYGKLDGWIWIGTVAEHESLQYFDDFHIKEPFYYDVKTETVFICSVYIHQAKIRPGSDNTGLCDSKVRVTLLNFSKFTSTCYASLSPIWNEIITFENIKLPGTIESYIKNPILIAVELFDEDKSVDHILGCGFMAVSVNHAQKRKANYRPQKPATDISSAAPPIVLTEIPTNTGKKGARSPSPTQPPSAAAAAADIDTISNNIDTKSQVSSSPTLNKMLNIKTQLDQFKQRNSIFPPPLKWLSICSDGVVIAQVLMSSELVESSYTSIEGLTTSINIEKQLPIEICPIMKRYKLEVIFGGLRQCERMTCCQSTIGKYKIKIMIGNLSLMSGPSGAKLNESINFLDLYSAGIVTLSEQLEYWPPIIITHVDCSKKHREVTLGAALIPNPSKYLVKNVFVDCTNYTNETSVSLATDSISEVSDERTTLLDLKKKDKPSKKRFNWNFLPSFPQIFPKKNCQKLSAQSTTDDLEFTWWTKFYYSLNKGREENIKRHELTIFTTELEKQPEFSFLQDWAESISLVQQFKKDADTPLKEQGYCTLKCNFKITSCDQRKENSNLLGSSHAFKPSLNETSSKFQELTSLMSEVKVVVRVYIVQGLRLRSHDARTSSDAFVKIQLGNKTISDRAHYIPNQSNPIFGKRFQLETTIPRDHILSVSVYDRGCCDDLIGTTTIDIEDRLRSKHHARVGISNEYNRSGYNVWRDTYTPFELLKQICKKYDLPPPNLDDTSIEVGGVKFRDTTQISTGEDTQERLSLTVLKGLQKIPQIGFQLVPEHVETRSLYRKDRPGVEQGKIQLWVEIYEPDYLPYPIDITPTPAQLYELRVTIFNLCDVILDERNIFGKKMSDIFVKGWVEDQKPQFTDVHYRSMTGAASFNWRMIFHLKYSKTEDMMVHKHGGNSTELKSPPTLFIQIWDSDTFSANDFLGALNINLSHFDEPGHNKSKPTIKQNPNKKRPKSFNLFNDQIVKGWFPCKKIINNSVKMTGKIELELQILSEAEAKTHPVGLGRDPPKPLPDPKREATSFHPFLHPLKSLKFIIGPVVKKCCICCCCFGLIALIIILFFTSIPTILFN